MSLFELEISGRMSSQRQDFFFYTKKCQSLLECFQTVCEIPNLPGAHLSAGTTKHFDVRIFSVNNQTGVRTLYKIFSIPASGAYKIVK